MPPEGSCYVSSSSPDGLNGDCCIERVENGSEICGNCREKECPSPSPFSSRFPRLRKIAYASIKGFAIGAGLRGGFALFSILSRMRKRGLSTRGDPLTNSEAILLSANETLRYGLFLGTFSGTYVSVDETVAKLGGHRRTEKWRSLLAGAVAGGSLLIMHPNTSLATYVLMRACVLATRCGIKSHRFGGVCRPLTWSHGDIFLMCIASSQILSAFILKRDSLPPSYKSFLDKHGGKHASIFSGVKSIATGKPIVNLEDIEKHYKDRGIAIDLDPEMKIPCSMIHGNESCFRHAISFFVDSYRRSVPVYIPVYLFPALIVHRQGLLKKPYRILGKNVLGIARSSLFLSAYCSSVWVWTCFLFNLFKFCDVTMVAMGTFPSGLALAIEKKSRRIEISLYCLGRAIESFFSCMADSGYLPQPKKTKRTDVLIFSLSTSIIMHCYAQERTVFRSKYVNVLDWVFGVPPPQAPPLKTA